MARIVKIAFQADAQGAVTGVKNLDGSVVKLDGDLEGTEKRIEALIRQLGLLEKQETRTGQQGQAAGRAVRGLGFIFNDAAGFAVDFRMGLLGIANNLGPLIEDMAELRKGTQGGTTAWQAMLSVLRGPVGIVAAVNLATTLFVVFGDEIVNAFSKGSEEGKKLQERLEEIKKEAEDAVVALRAVSGQQAAGRALGLEVTAEELHERLTQVKADMKALRDAGEDVVPVVTRTGQIITRQSQAMVNLLKEERDIRIQIEGVRQAGVKTEERAEETIEGRIALREAELEQLTDVNRELTKQEQERRDRIKAEIRDLEKKRSVNAGISEDEYQAALQRLQAADRDAFLTREQFQQLKERGTLEAHLSELEERAAARRQREAEKSATAFQRLQGHVRDLRRELESLSSAGVSGLAAVTDEAADLERQLRRLENLAKLARGEVRPGFREMGVDPLGVAEGVRERMLAEDARGALRTFSPEVIAEMEALEEEIRQRASNINFLLTDAFKSAFAEAAEFTQEGIAALGGLFENAHQRRLQQIASERDAELAALDERLENARLNEGEREALIRRRADLEAKYRKEEEEAERAAAKREKALAVFSIIVNTARAIVEALPNVARSIAVGAIGAAQLAVAASTPLPQVSGAKSGGDNASALGTSFLYTAPSRDSGGPVTAGRPYMIGTGPGGQFIPGMTEIFVPGQSGYVFPNGAFGASRTGAGGGDVVAGLEGLRRDLRGLHIDASVDLNQLRIRLRNLESNVNDLLGKR